MRSHRIKTYNPQKICFILITLMFLCGCGISDNTEIDSSWKAKIEDANEEFVEDYIYLWDVLENDYPSMPAAERISGKKAEDIKQKYYYQINMAKTPHDFYNIIVRPCINEFYGTGHLFVIDEQYFEMRYSSYLAYPDSIDNDECSKYAYEQLNLPQTKKFYKDAIAKAEDNYKNQNGTMSAYTLSSLSSAQQYSKENLRFEYYPEKSTAYIEILSMREDPKDLESLQKFFEKIESEGYKNCIIDIRENRGGSNLFWKLAFVLPNSTEKTSLQYYSLIKSEKALKYIESSGLCETFPISELLKSDFPSLNNDDMTGITHFANYKVNVGFNPKGKLYNGKLWLLVSDHTYSASENFTRYCKETAFATIVGTASGGDGINCIPMIVALPNTGICFEFSADYTLNSDGSGSEEFGTSADYVISKGQDALDKCLSLID